MSRFKIEIGGKYFWHGEDYRLIRFVSLKIGLFRKVGGDKEVEIPVWEMGAKQDQEKCDLTALPATLLQPAQEKMEFIRPILDKRSTREVQKVAEACGKSISTVYRWRQKFLARGSLAALVTVNHRGAGESRLKDEVEAIVRRVIEDKFLLRKWKITKVQQEITAQCNLNGLPAPHYNTVRNRILALEPATVVKNQQGLSAWKGQYQQKYRHYTARYPLHVIQIDHVKLNILIVDSVFRSVITKRIWITIAIDIFSRVVVGYSLSRNDPNTLSVALAMTTCILPKEKLLQKYQIPGQWDVFGLMDAISLDNALVFHSQALKFGCDTNDIDILWRQVRTPEYGGHIERLAKTLKDELRSWSGTTFSNPVDKGEHDPRTKAVYTLEELECRFVDYVTNTYHVGFHKGIQTTPLRKYEEGIVGDGLSIGRGWPDLPDDPEMLLVSFLPGARKTVQRDGITWDHLQYQSKDLRQYLYKNKKGDKSKTYLVKRDPRDITIIYFYVDEEQGKYIQVPLSDSGITILALDEWLAFTRERRSRGKAAVDNKRLLEAYKRQQEREEAAVLSTKRARKTQRKNSKPSPASQPSRANADLEILPDDVKPLKEILYD